MMSVFMERTDNSIFIIEVKLIIVVVIIIRNDHTTMRRGVSSISVDGSMHSGVVSAVVTRIFQFQIVLAVSNAFNGRFSKLVLLLLQSFNRQVLRLNNTLLQH